MLHDRLICRDLQDVRFSGLMVIMPVSDDSNFSCIAGTV